METGGLSELRFLIVDDNAHMVSIVKTVLRGFGAATFFEARNADEAFELLSAENIDLVIADYELDGEDGTDLVRRIRTNEDSANPYIPIIMLTAYCEKSRVEAARDAGATEFCAKPVTAIDIYRKISACIVSPRSFVRTTSYFGPDRRRWKDADFSGDERRASEIEQAVENS